MQRGNCVDQHPIDVTQKYFIIYSTFPAFPPDAAAIRSLKGGLLFVFLFFSFANIPSHFSNCKFPRAPVPSLPVWTEAAASLCTATTTSNASAFRRFQGGTAVSLFLSYKVPSRVLRKSLRSHVCAFFSLCHHSGKTVSSFCRPLMVHYSQLPQHSCALRDGGKTRTQLWR